MVYVRVWILLYHAVLIHSSINVIMEDIGRYPSITLCIECLRTQLLVVQPWTVPQRWNFLDLRRDRRKVRIRIEAIQVAKTHAEENIRNMDLHTIHRNHAAFPRWGQLRLVDRIL